MQWSEFLGLPGLPFSSSKGPPGTTCLRKSSVFVHTSLSEVLPGIEPPASEGTETSAALLLDNDKDTQNQRRGILHRVTASSALKLLTAAAKSTCKVDMQGEHQYQGEQATATESQEGLRSTLNNRLLTSVAREVRPSSEHTHE